MHGVCLPRQKTPPSDWWPAAAPLLLTQEAVKHTQYNRLRDRNGKAPGLLGWWPQRSCTFVDNHDTGSTQQVGLWAAGQCFHDATFHPAE